MVLSVSARSPHLLAIAALLGCSPPPSEGSASAASSATAPGAPLPSTASVGSGPRSVEPKPAKAPARAPLAGAWRGPFVAQVGKVTLDPGVSDPWSKDPGTDAVGKGELELKVAADGTVTGRLTGALGDLLVKGVAEENLVHATFTAERPEPKTMAGTLELALSNGKLDGELRGSSGDASLVRKANVSAARVE